MVSIVQSHCNMCLFGVHFLTTSLAIYHSNLAVWLGRVTKKGSSTLQCLCQTDLTFRQYIQPYWVVESRSRRGSFQEKTSTTGPSCVCRLNIDATCLVQYSSPKVTKLAVCRAAQSAAKAPHTHLAAGIVCPMTMVYLPHLIPNTPCVREIWLFFWYR